jgi:hypothetical protein
MNRNMVISIESRIRMVAHQHYSIRPYLVSVTEWTYSKKPELRSMNRLSAFPTSEARANDLVAAAYRISLTISIRESELTDNRASPSVVN